MFDRKNCPREGKWTNKGRLLLSCTMQLVIPNTVTQFKNTIDAEVPEISLTEEKLNHTQTLQKLRVKKMTLQNLRVKKMQ